MHNITINMSRECISWHYAVGLAVLTIFDRHEHFQILYLNVTKILQLLAHHCQVFSEGRTIIKQIISCGGNQSHTSSQTKII